MKLPICYFPKDCENLNFTKFYFGHKWFPVKNSKEFYIGGHYDYNGGNGTCILGWTTKDLSKTHKIIGLDEAQQNIILEQI